MFPNIECVEELNIWVGKSKAWQNVMVVEVVVCKSIKICQFCQKDVGID